MTFFFSIYPSLTYSLVDDVLFSGKSGDFTCNSCGEEVENVSTNQRQGHFFITPRETIVVSLVTGHASCFEEVENVKSLRQTDERTDGRTPNTFRPKISA